MQPPKVEFESGTETYVIHVTKECNMACRYCYESDKTSTYTLEEIQRVTRQLLDNRKASSFNIEFLGGEPLLAPGNIREVIRIVDEEYGLLDSVIFGFTTNGSTDPRIVQDIILEHPTGKYGLHFSHDGTKFMNQLRVFKSGVNAHDIVKDNYKTQLKFKEAHPELNLDVGVHMTIHPYNVGYLSHGIEYLYHAFSCRAVAVGIIESTMSIGKEFADRFISEMCDVSDKVKQGKLPGMAIREFAYLRDRRDSRSYVYDAAGKSVIESYGRSPGDYISQLNTPSSTGEGPNEEYTVNVAKDGAEPDELTSYGLLLDIYETVYMYHNTD